MFFEVALIALLAGISPGPDFLVVSRNALSSGRDVGVASAVGVALALSVHASYSILGLSYVLVNYHLAFQAVQLCGAAYLAYLGVSSIVGTFRKDIAPASLPTQGQTKGVRQGFQDGLLCNLLNPKAYVFFLSIFSQFMSVQTPLWMEWVYAAEVVVVIGLWFVVVAFGVSTNAMGRLYARARKAIDRVLGAVLVAIAGRIALSTFGK